jgi:hypothetical protein
MFFGFSLRSLPFRHPASMVKTFFSSFTDAQDKKPFQPFRGTSNLMGEILKTYWGQVFNYKLGFFDMNTIVWHIEACPHLDVKPRARFFLSAQICPCLF